MNQSSGISRDEWLKALGECVTPPDPDAFTVRELGQMFRLGECAMRRKLDMLVQGGKAIKTSKLIEMAHGGSRRAVAYKLVKDATRPATRRR